MMKKEKFIEMTKEIDEICHVQVSAPEYEFEPMTISFLDGTLKGMIVKCENHNIIDDLNLNCNTLAR